MHGMKLIFEQTPPLHFCLKVVCKRGQGRGGGGGGGASADTICIDTKLGTRNGGFELTKEAVVTHMATFQ